MKKCPNCGKENIDEAKFYIWCSAGFSIDEKKRINVKTLILKIMFGIAAVAVYICLGVFLIKFLNGESKIGNVSVADGGEYLAPFMNDESQWGYINMDGEVIIECKYDYASSFDKDGYAVVGKKQIRMPVHII